MSSLPSILFFASCLSFLHPSRFLSHLFSFLVSFFPLLRFFFRFTVMSRVVLFLLLTLSFHFLISQRHLRTFRGVCTFPALFSMLDFLSSSFISLSPCLAPSKRCSEYIHVLKGLLLLSFLFSILSSPFFFFFFVVVVFVFVLRYRKSAENIHTPKSVSTLPLSSVLST